MPVLVAVDDARVLYAAVVQGDEVRVVGEKDPALAMGMGELHGVSGPEEADIRRRRHVDAAEPQTVGDGAATRLIEVEVDRLRHRVSSASVP